MVFELVFLFITTSCNLYFRVGSLISYKYCDCIVPVCEFGCILFYRESCSKFLFLSSNEIKLYKPLRAYISRSGCLIDIYLMFLGSPGRILSDDIYDCECTIYISVLPACVPIDSNIHCENAGLS